MGSCISQLLKLLSKLLILETKLLKILLDLLFLFSSYLRVLQMRSILVILCLESLLLLKQNLNLLSMEIRSRLSGSNRRICCLCFLKKWIDHWYKKEKIKSYYTLIYTLEIDLQVMLLHKDTKNKYYETKIEKDK